MNSPPNTALAGGILPQRADLAAANQPIGATNPLLGGAAVQPAATAGETGSDPWPQRPPVPAPLKGLGIPPLNTRQVGDFDRLDAPERPVAHYDSAPNAAMTARLDLLA